MLGDNLSGLNAQFLMAESADELQGLLSQIRTPIKLITIYASGSRHYAWFNSSTTIKKKRVAKKVTEK